MEIRGDDIQEARKKAGFTQESLADVAGFSPRQISRFESGENLVRLNKYYKLFENLFVDSDKKEE